MYNSEESCEHFKTSICHISRKAVKCKIYNERSSEAAKHLPSVARKMVMRRIPHSCQEDDELYFLSTKVSYVLLLKRKWRQSRVKWVNTELCYAHYQFSVLQSINCGYVLTHPRLRTKKRNIRVLPWNLCTNSTLVMCVCCDVQRLFSLRIWLLISLIQNQ